MSNHNNYSKSLNIKFGSLNCRYLLKLNNPQLSDSFIRYLRSQKCDIFAFQETNIPSLNFSDRTSMLDLKFQCKESIWTSKCGLLNFNNNIHMEMIHKSDDGRFILAKLTVPSEPNLLPLYVLNIYAPADTVPNKTAFYNNLMAYLKSLHNYSDILDRLILAGDFNFQYDLRLPGNFRYKQPTSFVRFTDTFLHDCNNNYSDPFFETLPTFRRGPVIKTLDYIMVGRQLKDLYFNNNIEYIPNEWTDHDLMTVNFKIQLTNTGKGLWRANPNLVQHKSYVKKINSGISHFMQNILSQSSDSNQIKWDRLKGYVKKLTKCYCSNRSSWRKDRLRELQSSRNLLIRTYKNDQQSLQNELPKVEHAIARIQHELNQHATLQAGKRWLAHNENSVGFLKRTGERRLAQRYFVHITHPQSGVTCSSTADKLDAVHSYYNVLYSPEPTHQYSMNRILAHIQTTITAEDADYIVSDIDLDDILISSKRCPKVSSPGKDGLPYPILRLILTHPDCKTLVTSVYNDAIHLGIFPKSWQETCIVLLPKKGDTNDLANWRPISLINTDCKVFTRILNSRVIDAANKVITQFQAGFMPTRFIGDHGLALRILMEDAKIHNTGSVGVAIDSAKAYDYVNETYLCKVLSKFGFPPKFIQCISNLFFKNQIVVNMNGFMSDSVAQKRGLRQGDSISPVLFNFALEPLLLAILQDRNIQGYALQTQSTKKIPSVQVSAPSPIKFLAYADDLLVIVRNRTELQAIQDHLTCYGRASNARVNYHKTVAFPLSGLKSRVPPDLLHLTQRLRFRWFDSSSPSYIKYLGYPIWFSIPQREVFSQETILSLQTSLDTHMTRSVSVYGRARMVNSLFLARFWHFLRITVLPVSFVEKLSSLVYQFVCYKIFPPMKKAVIYSPLDQGGLAVLDITVQQHILQQRYVRALLLDNEVSQPIPNFLMQSLSTFIQVCYGASHPHLPLLFTQYRSNSLLTGLHCLLPLLRSIDAFSVQTSWDSCHLNYETLLLLPFTELCHQDNTEPCITQGKKLSKLPVRNFLEPSRLHDSFVFTTRSRCLNISILTKIISAFRSDHLKFHSFFQVHLKSPSGPLPQGLSAVEVDFSPYLCHKLNYQGIPVLSMTNTQLRAMYMRDHPPISRPQVALKQLHMASFLHTKMPSAARNLWFRLIHNKVSAKANTAHILRLSDDLCINCGLRETTTHFLFTCPSIEEVWLNYFGLVFVPTESLRLGRVYDDVMALNLSSYRLLDSNLKITVFEAFTCILSAIWRAKWLFFFESVDSSNESITDRAMISLRRLSSLNICN